MGIQGRCDEGRQAVAILLSAFPRDCALEGGLRLPPVAIRGREQSPPVVASSGRDEDPGHVSLNTFITSSPRWLMTFTAMRPDLGLSKARDVSLCRVAQAASSISALSVHDEGYQVDRQPDGELRFRRPDGRVLPEVPRPPEGGHTAASGLNDAFESRQVTTLAIEGAPGSRGLQHVALDHGGNIRRIGEEHEAAYRTELPAQGRPISNVSGPDPSDGPTTACSTDEAA